jgi:hypothetical protein
MTHGTRRFGARTTLRLEALDDRALPSVTVVEADGVLTVRGDARANEVTITDNGTGDAGAVTVEVVGGDPFTSTAAVTTIRVYAGSGADNVEYNLSGDLAVNRAVNVYLGNQHDTFVGNVTFNVLENVEFDFLVNGGNGHDNLSLVWTGDVATGAVVDVEVLGGNGKDSLNVDLTGVFNGTVDLRVSGGNGKDAVTANVNAEAGSGGTVDAMILGGNGKDTMTVSETHVTPAEGSTDPAVNLTVTIHGGNGKDDFELTGDLTAIDDPKSK